MNRKSQPKTSSTRSFPLKAVFALLFVVAVGSALGYYYYAQLPEPPAVPSENVDYQITRAIRTARSTVKKNPRSSDAWGKLGMLFHTHEFKLQAAACYDVAHQLDPNEPKWLFFHANVIRNTKIETAIQLLRKANQLGASKQTSTELLLIELLLEVGELDKAKERIDPILQSTKSNQADAERIRARHALARYRFLNSEYQKCRAEIEAVRKEIDQYTVLENQRADGFRKQAAVTKDPNQRAQIGAQMKKLAQRANDRINACLKMQKTLGLLYASTLRQLGEPELAKKERTRAEAQSDSAWGDPWTNELIAVRTGQKRMLVKADIAFARKDFDTSIQILNQIVQQYPKSVPAFTMLGRAHIRKGRIFATQATAKRENATLHYSQAIRVLQQGLQVDQNSVELLFRLGVVYTYQAELQNRKEFYQQAENVLRRAIALKDDFTTAHYNLADALVKQRKFLEAAESMRNTVRIEPEYAEGHERLAYILALMGQFDEANKHAQIAAKLAPKNRRVRKTIEFIRAKQLGLE